MEDVRNIVLIVAGIIASIKALLDIYDRFTKSDDKD